MKLSENAEQVMQMRYLREGETSEQRFKEMCKAVAKAESTWSGDPDFWAERFYTELVEPLYFLPNSPCIGNAGRPVQQLSACFVLPVPDSMEGIFQAVKEMALIQKSGGGTGFSFSELRPKGSVVAGTGGVSSGPVSFMKVFDAASESIKQGSSRRGANMGILHVDHPDIEEFITCKADMISLQNFNISVAITNEFMNKVINNDTWANKIFDLIVENAWKNGDPGLFFIDRANEDNTLAHIGSYMSTNPCGEMPLIPYDSCNLGSIDLSKFVVEGRFDWEHFKRVIVLAVRFLDDVIEVNKYPIPQLDEMSRLSRKIGLGVMGFADALFKLGIKYDSFGGLETAETMAWVLKTEADKASELLALERGVYPAYDSKNPLNNGRRFRNSTRTTVAPTGTLSILANCSGGIEPIFSLAFVRQHRLDKENPLSVTNMVEVNDIFDEQINILQVSDKRGLFEYLINGGVLSEYIDKQVSRLSNVFRTSFDITPEYHIRMSAMWQKHIDSGVSKTINMPEEATKENIRESYILAWKLSAKGVTIYRDGSRAVQVLVHQNKSEVTLAIP